MIRSFGEIMTAVLRQERPRTIAVALAQEPEILQAVGDARERGLANSILVGGEEEIRAIAGEIGLDLEGFTIVNEPDPAAAAARAVELVRTGEADILMKGLVGTATLLRAVLDKERGLRSGQILSHVAVFEPPGFGRLLLLTDAAMNIAPDLQRKAEIIRNAALIANALGIERPKVAPLCALELVNPEMPATVDAALLSKMAQRGQLPGVEVDGPLALDNAVSPEAARRKGIQSPVAGQADILLVPGIEVGNVIYKTLHYFCPGVKIAGLVTGARAPIVLTSRADSHETKLNSIALSLLVSSTLAPGNS
ncbi:MAG TPA: phosphate butyryltransferase [Firmicutes bacterium]|nr:phosphate butyryltransferase [Bacillota bacterium]